MIFDLYSRRQRLHGEVPDVYQYDEIPEPLRVKLSKLITGSDFTNNYNIHMLTDRSLDIFKNEYGLLDLPVDHHEVRNMEKHFPEKTALFFTYFIKHADTKKCLDLLECFFESFKMDYMQYDEDQMQEMNHRFKEHSVGYQIENGQIIRIDSQYLHAEAVKPALEILSDEKFASANGEFLEAHKFYRQGDYEHTLTECGKCFESTMKIICNERNWPFETKDRASKLVEILLKQELISNVVQEQFTSLGNLLKSAIPTPRNNMGAHGDGVNRIDVPEYLASFLLHQTAATVLLLVQAHKAKP